MAPAREAERKRAVRLELERRPRPWTALAVLVAEYSERRVVAVCSRAALAARLTLAAQQAGSETEREAFAGCLQSLFEEPHMVPVFVVGGGQVAFMLGTPEYFTGAEAP